MTTIKISGDVIADIFPCNDNMPLPDFKTSDDPYGTAYAEHKTEQFAQSLIDRGLDPLVMVRALFMGAALKAVRYELDDFFTRFAHDYVTSYTEQYCEEDSPWENPTLS